MDRYFYCMAKPYFMQEAITYNVNAPHTMALKLAI